MIDFFDVSKIYPGNRVALADVTVRIERGQFAVLAGSSGAGKSTFLRLIYRATVPTEGQILVNGRNLGSLPAKKVPYLRRTMGVVFQDFSLIERKTVSDNVTFLPRILGVDAKARRRLAEQALEQVGLRSHLDSYPAELSGGEQQRVAIARALISKPDLVLADEPTGNLDPHLSRGIMQLFSEINRQGTTIVLASHDPELRKEFGERLLVLDGGRLVADEKLGQEGRFDCKSWEQMNILQALSYFTTEAIRNLIRGWRISLLAVATTALSLFIGSVMLLAGNNLARAIEGWRSEAQIVVYLEEDLSAEEVAALVEEVRGFPGVGGVFQVGSDRALERFRERFPDLEEILLEIERSPFPVSLEIEVAGDRGVVDAWLAGLRARPGVTEVDDDAEWLESMNRVASVARAVGFLVGGILMSAAAISIASVVRLSTFVYRKEIVAMRLIGATEFFVRGPFVVEGIVQGLVGSCIALSTLWLTFRAFGWLDMPWVVRDTLVGFFMTPVQALALLVVGAVAGLVGGIIPLRDRAGVFG